MSPEAMGIVLGLYFVAAVMVFHGMVLVAQLADWIIKRLGFAKTRKS